MTAAKETTISKEATISEAAIETTTSPEGETAAASIKDQTQDEATETNSGPEVMDISNKVLTADIDVVNCV